jgi:hypothetical protein
MFLGADAAAVAVAAVASAEAEGRQLLARRRAKAAEAGAAAQAVQSALPGPWHPARPSTPLVLRWPAAGAGAPGGEEVGAALADGRASPTSSTSSSSSSSEEEEGGGDGCAAIRPFAVRSVYLLSKPIALQIRPRVALSHPQRPLSCARQHRARRQAAAGGQRALGAHPPRPRCAAGGVTPLVYCISDSTYKHTGAH